MITNIHLVFCHTTRRECETKLLENPRIWNQGMIFILLSQNKTCIKLENTATVDRKTIRTSRYHQEYILKTQLNPFNGLGGEMQTDKLTNSFLNAQGSEIPN